MFHSVESLGFIFNSNTCSTDLAQIFEDTVLIIFYQYCSFNLIIESNSSFFIQPPLTMSMLLRCIKDEKVKLSEITLVSSTELIM